MYFRPQCSRKLFNLIPHTSSIIDSNDLNLVGKPDLLSQHVLRQFGEIVLNLHDKDFDDIIFKP